MSSISNNYNNSPPNLESFSEFKNLTLKHKILTVITGIAITILTVGIGTYFIVPSLIGCFRELEIEDFDEDDEVFRVNEAFSRTFGQNREVNQAVEAFSDDYAGKFKEHLDQHLQSKGKDPGSIKESDLVLVLEEYISFKKKEDQKFDLNERQKLHLLDFFKTNLIQEPLVADFEFPYKLSDEEEIHVLKTLDDGSCGIYALKGVQETPDKPYSSDALQERKDFCTKLEYLRKEGNLPLPIETLLHNYFISKTALNESEDHPVDHPLNQFRAKMLAKKEALLENYNKIPRNEGDEFIKKHFIYDEEVFKIYLDHLARVDTYLEIDEIEALAILSDIRVRLIQPGRIGDEKGKLVIMNYNESGKSEVCIYFDGRNHFSRAEIRAINT